jgi:hypothetical protein
VGVLAFLLGGDPLVTLGGAFATAVLLATTAAVLVGVLAWTLVGRAVAAAEARRRRTRRRVDEARRRVARTLARAEAASPRLAALDLSGRVAPPNRDRAARLAALKRRYVAGEVSEAAFERGVDEILDGGPGRIGESAGDVSVDADAHAEGVRASDVAPAAGSSRSRSRSRSRPRRRGERLRGDRLRE